MSYTTNEIVGKALIVMQQNIIHIGIYAVYLHKFPVKFINLFLGSPVVF